MSEIRMSTDEAEKLWRQIAATWPHSAKNDDTIIAWYASLAKFPYRDCREAVENLAEREPQASLPAIVTEVKRIRGARAERHNGVYYRPSRGDLSAAEMRDEQRAFYRALADGEAPPAPPVLERPVDVMELTGGGKRMPGTDVEPYRAPVSARARALARVYRERAEAEQ